MRTIYIRYLDYLFLSAYSILALFTAENCYETYTVDVKISGVYHEGNRAYGAD